MASLSSSPETFTIDNIHLYRVITVDEGKPHKTLIFQGTLILYSQDGNDDDDEDQKDVLILKCGNILTLPVAGQHFERFENNLFVVPADNGSDEEVAATLPGFVTFGFKLSTEDALGDATDVVVQEFQELLIKNALFTDRRKCYAAKKVQVGASIMSNKIAGGATMFGNYTSSGSKYLQSKLKKSKKDVDLTKTSSTISSVKNISGKAANATQVVSKKIIKVSIETGHYVGDKVSHISYIQRLKSKRRAAAKKNKGKPLSRIDRFVKGATEVGVALGSGGLGIFCALNDAADVILDDSIHAASDVMEHKYGEQAGQLTEDTLGIGVDGFKIYKTGAQGTKKLAKGIATDAALQGTGALVLEALDDDV